MRSRTAIFVWVLMVLPARFVYLESQVAHFEHITSSEGLSNNEINDIIQDSEGYIWFATDDGLNRYDGYNFKVFRHQIYDSTSLSSGMIYCLHEDRSGQIWVGTEKGLSRYVKATGEFQNFSFPGEDTQDNLNEVLSIEVDDQGIVWALLRKRLVRFDPRSNEYESFKLEVPEGNNRLSRARTTMYYHVGTGDLIIGNRNGIQVFNTGYKRFICYGLRGIPVYDITTGNQPNTLLVGTREGLFYFSGNEEGIEYASYREYLAGKRILKVITDNDDIYILDEHGIARINNPVQGNFSITPVFEIEGLPDFSRIRTSCIDRSQTAWIGTSRGLFHKDLKPKKFYYYSTNSRLFRLHADVVSSILTTDRYILVGTWNGGLEFIDRTALTSEFIPFRSSNGRFVRGVNMLFRDSNGEVWVGANSLYKFDTVTHSLREEAQVFSGYQGDDMPESRIFDAIELPGNQMVVAHASGLYLIDHAQKTIRNDSVIFVGQHKYNLYNVTCLESDSKYLYIGWAEGILKKEIETGEYVYLASENGIGLTGKVLTMKIDHKGTLWVGTPAGLFRYEKDNGKFRGYSVEQGFANDFIYSIEEDLSGLMWLGTNKGIISFNPELETVRNYSVQHGLSSMEFNLNASDYSKDGLMFFGSIHGVNFFNPDSVLRNVPAPSIQVTGYNIFNRESACCPPAKDGKIDLKDDESVQLMFSVLDFTNPAYNSYQYRLERVGENAEWNPIGSDNSVILSGLKNGEYRFEVSGINSDGILSSNTASVDIRVHAPFHRRKIFLVLMVVPLLLILIILFEYRTRTLRRSNRALREKEIAAKEVLRQKNLLSRRNKNIEDSLKYAQRIQYAMFTNAREIAELFPESFILQQPKDIVSGDFFWAKKINSKIFLAAVDCTGHGVPGAFMSLIGLEFFRQIITVKHIYKPSEVLNHLNFSFDELFDSVQDISLKDGMDVSFCAFDTEANTMEYAGAFSSIYHIRNNELTEIKSDKITIGPNTGCPRRPFRNHEIELEPDDVIYLFSDGFADQFGGPEGKKFKYRRFRHLLLSVYEKPVDQQFKILESSINDWKGAHEQVDDIMVIGIRPYTRHE